MQNLQSVSIKRLVITSSVLCFVPIVSVAVIRILMQLMYIRSLSIGVPVAVLQVLLSVTSVVIAAYALSKRHARGFFILLISLSAVFLVFMGLLILRSVQGGAV